MRQVVIPRYGPPDVFETRELPDPSPGDGEIRIRVRAAGVNFADVLARLGLYPDAPKPPLVVGYEVAGHIDAVGRSVVGLAEGDRVVALTRFGGYADTVVVPAAQAFHFPDALSDSEAAAVPVNYITAALALYRMAALSPGETVLVHNAGGGVGIAATQLARLRRATVIGTASAFKHAALRSFGVDHAIDYQHANVAEEVKTLTRGRGVDVILDPIGGRSFTASYRMLAPLGRLIIFGLSAAAPGERRNVWHAFQAWMSTCAVQPAVAHEPQPRRLRPERRPSLGRAAAARAAVRDAVQRAARRTPQAGRRADVPARAGRRRAPVHSGPAEHRESGADHVGGTGGDGVNGDLISPWV